MRKALFAAAIVVAALAATGARADAEGAWRAYGEGRYAAALNELERLVRANQPDAEFFLGSIYREGMAVARDYRKAASLFASAAAQGHPGAQAALGSLYRDGAGKGEDAVSADSAAALRWSLAAAERGIASAQNEMGLLKRAEADAEGRIEAYRWFILAARQGYAGADRNMAAAGARLDERGIAEALRQADAFVAKP